MGDAPTEVTETVFARSVARHQHLLDHDPDGAFVATVGEQVIGCALALRRDGLWGLSLLNVDPTVQSAGTGRRLLQATLPYAAGCSTAVIESSADARAIRLYATSDFALFPQVKARGVPSLAARPTRPRAQEATSPDPDFADAVDRQVRGAGHGPDHALISQWGPMFVVDDAHGRGYAYLRHGHVYLLAASDDDTATELLWASLARAAESGESVEVNAISAEQQWAIRTCLAAGLSIGADGPVFWRGTTPPPGYLPSGAFL
jgi:GNAT superfamily N-acetyltransferase